MSCPSCGGDVRGEELGTSADVPCSCEPEGALERLREDMRTIRHADVLALGVERCAEVLEEGRLRELNSANKARLLQDVQAEENCLIRADTLEDYKDRLRSVVEAKDGR